ncbi:MAG: type II toxin-antitoxin system RelE/ParE family toxin [Gammaproteobacteria bacterium]|nr:type II toxin-antitoxin system RelE/ParE family toxin [Gammaproteobacteria bacterium]
MAGVWRRAADGGAGRRALGLKRVAGAFQSRHPDMGRPGWVPWTREWVLPHFSCIIPYRVREQRVEILRVFHTTRKWPEGSDAS